MPLPGCLSSQTKFSCLGNWGLAAHQTLHLNGRKLLHAEVAHDCPEVLLLLWPLYLESIFHFKCKPLTEASHQTKPCWVHSPGNLVNLQKFAAFYFVQKERHLWNSLCTRSSGISAKCGGQCWFQKLADGHLLFLFCSLTIHTGGVSFSFVFQNSLLHWGTKLLSLAISKVHLFIVALGHYKNKENHGTW